MLSASTKLAFVNIFTIRSPSPTSGLESSTRVLDIVTPHCRMATAAKSNTRNSTAYSHPGNGLR